METKKREGWKVIITPEAKKRIENDQCPSCGKPKEEWDRRKDWRCCSEPCTRKYCQEMQTVGWQGLRWKAFERDKFKCVKCGHQPPTLYREFIKESTWINGKEHISWCPIDLFSWKTDTGQLVGDHITPIAIGGDEWDINNIQTLCVACNKIKTRKDQGIIAAYRKRPKEQETLCQNS